jgi:type II secretory pathway component PulM
MVKMQSFLLKVFSLLARVVGILSILGGIVALYSATLQPAERWINVGIGVFLLAAGFGLIVAKPATTRDIEKVRSLVDWLRRRPS